MKDAKRIIAIYDALLKEITLRLDANQGMADA